MNISQKQIRVKGKAVSVNSITINDNVVIAAGFLPRIARLSEEWYKDIEEPETIIREIAKSGIKADIFTFWQRLPNIKPKYNYYMEWDNYAALPITNYSNWLDKEIDRSAKKHIKKALKEGVDVRVVDPNDELVHGIEKIFNETPVRQGKKFWHYGKNFNAIKEEILLPDRENSEFIGAFHKEQLIGFVKLIYTKEYASFAQILSMIKYRDIAPTNALIAKTVDVCASKNIPYLVYGNYSYGKKGEDSLSDFKRRNGFVKIDVPRYFIPITISGKILIRLNLHRGLSELIPDRMRGNLYNLRQKWYASRHVRSSK